MIGRTNVGGGGGGQTWSIKGWCETVGLSYVFLDDITEVDMRTLMTKYASVAYFREWYTSEPSMIDQFIANTYAMKWIGLRDYICDKLMAVSDFKTKALASANWEYILKDHVPVMTSNTAPYGEAYADVTYGANYSAFNAFSADRSKVWADSGNSTLGHFIYYKFVNPICVKKFLIEQYVPSGGSERLSSVNLEASNDGTNWTSISSNINVHGRTDYTYLVDVNNNNYYLYYRIVIAGKLVADCILMRTLQFYGRSMNVVSSTQPLDRPYVYINSTYYTVDYSERTNRTYLYDHGLEFMTNGVSGWSSGESGTSLVAPTKESSQIYLQLATSTDISAFCSQQGVDFTNFSKIYVRNGDKASTNISSYAVLWICRDKNLAHYDALLIINTLGTDLALDVSALSGSKYIGFVAGETKRAYSFTELWLE